MANRTALVRAPRSTPRRKEYRRRSLRQCGRSGDTGSDMRRQRYTTSSKTPRKYLRSRPSTNRTISWSLLFPPRSRPPAIVMEKMLTNLHEVLDPETEGQEEREDSENKPYIPLDLKCSILLDVGHGLAFLHSRSPPIIQSEAYVGEHERAQLGMIVKKKKQPFFKCAKGR